MATIACKKHGYESIHIFQKYNSAECAAYLQYKWHESDDLMLKSIGQRQKHCREVMECESPTSSPHVSNVKDDGDCKDEEVVDVLVSLGSGMSTVVKFSSL